MGCGPLNNHASDPGGQLPPKKAERFNGYQRSLVPISGVEMWRLMIVVVHRDHNPEEATELWHGSLSASFAVQPGQPDHNPVYTTGIRGSSIGRPTPELSGAPVISHSLLLNPRLASIGLKALLSASAAGEMLGGGPV